MVSNEIDELSQGLFLANRDGLVLCRSGFIFTLYRFVKLSHVWVQGEKEDILTYRAQVMSTYMVQLIFYSIIKVHKVSSGAIYLVSDSLICIKKTFSQEVFPNVS